MTHTPKTHVRWNVEMRDANRKLRRSYTFLALEGTDPQEIHARIDKFIARTDGQGWFTITGRNIRTGRKVTLK